MALQLHTPPDQARAALVRHIANRLGMDDHALARETAALPIKSLVDCLDIRPDGTRRRLQALLKVRAATPKDHRIATHDGFVWRDARNNMRDGDAIVQRMAQDLRSVRAESAEGCCSEDDLRRLGWPAWMIRAYGGEAVRAAVTAEAA